MNTQETNKIPCPVCGKTLVMGFDICTTCFWQNDPNQLNHPELRGANRMTIEEARAAYKAGEPVK